MARNGYDDEGDSQTYTDVEQSWGGAAPRIGIGFNAATENAGFVMDLHTWADSTIKVGDNCYVWVKPIDMVKLTLGKNDSSLGTNSCFGLWDWMRVGAISGEENDIFDKHINRNVSAIITPIEGLTIGMGMNPAVDGTQYKLADVFGRTGAIAVTYNIAGVGTVKVGVQGDGRDSDAYASSNGTVTKTAAKQKYYEDDDGGDYKDYAVFNAAFELTAVENLWAAIGVKYGTEAYVAAGFDKNGNLTTSAADIKTDIKTDDGNVVYVKAFTPEIALAASYKVDALTLHLNGDIKLDRPDLKEEEVDGQLGFKVGAGVEYNLDGGLSLLADVRYANGIWMKGTSADHSDSLVFGVAALKNVTNGSIGVGFETWTNGVQKSATDDPELAWAIPVRFQVGF